MTRGRWIGVAAAVMLLVLGFWIARHVTWEPVEVPLPLRGEARRNPFYAAQRFVEALGATASWEHALGRPSSDAVVYVSGFHWSLIDSRRRAIERWVEAGGRLVVDNQLLGTEEFERWSGITREIPKPKSSDDDLDDALERAEAVARRERCRDLEDEHHARFAMCQYIAPSWLASRGQSIWTLRNQDGIQALRVRIGRGTVTALNASPFGNEVFTEGDHARIFVALTDLTRDDEVHFLSENESPSLTALVWKTGAPVVVIFSIWVALTLWRGGVRFGPLAPRAELVRRSLAEQIRGTGHFALRSGDGDALHMATLRALSRAAQRRIPGFLTLDTDARAAAIARVTSADAASLTAAITAVDLRRVQDLRNAVALLETTRRELLLRTPRPSHGTD
jgi:hypothetical protein